MHTPSSNQTHEVLSPSSKLRHKSIVSKKALRCSDYSSYGAQGHLKDVGRSFNSYNQTGGGTGAGERVYRVSLAIFFRTTDFILILE